MRPNTPAGFKPPFEAYEATYRAADQPMICCFLGIQDRGGEIEPSLTATRALLAAPHGPEKLEQGWSDDVAGAFTHIYMAYWRDPAGFERWRNAPAFRGWLETGCRERLIGRWIECSWIAPKGLDTLIADPKVAWGVAGLADSIEITPYHGYWGGTRDRIVLSADSALENPDGAGLPKPRQAAVGIGEIVEVRLPQNAVVARGGPDWSVVVDEELDEFRSSVYPAYVRGTRYLRDNSTDAGCYAAYRVQETDAAGRDVKRNHLIAYFTQLSHLERWTRSHPTHLEIFGRFMRLVEKVGGLPKVNLYHEVAVIPRNGNTALYANCLPETGLLRFGSPYRHQ